MSKPIETAPWATDANYTSGPYTGTPTKVASSVGEAERGHTPGAKTAAQKQNFWQNVVGKWIDFLAPLFGDNGLIEPTRTFWQTLASVGNTTTNIANGYVAGVGVNAASANAVITNACAIDLKPGDRISDISVMLEPTGAAQTVTLQLFVWSIDAGAMSFRSLQLEITDPPAGAAIYNASNATLTGGPLTVAADEACHWSLSMGAVGTNALAAGITKDRLNG
jgi:hypothetical protein